MLSYCSQPAVVVVDYGIIPVEAHLAHVAQINHIASISVDIVASIAESAEAYVDTYTEGESED